MQAQRDPAVWQAAIAPYRRYQQYFAALAEEGIQESSLRPAEASAIGRVMVSMAIGLLMQGLFDPQGADWEQETQASLQLLLQGIAREAE